MPIIWIYLFTIPKPTYSKNPIYEPSVLRKICAFVGPETYEEAKQVFDKVVLVDEFSQYDKKKAKKLAREYDFFVAQANIMPQIAKTFGRYLGPLGKMPNPKFGQLFPPKGAKLSNLYERLQKMVILSAKKVPLIYVPFGVETMEDEKLAENLNVQQIIPYTDRMDYIAAINENHSVCIAAEKLLGIHEKIP